MQLPCLSVCSYQTSTPRLLCFAFMPVTDKQTVPCMPVTDCLVPCCCSILDSLTPPLDDQIAALKASSTDESMLKRIEDQATHFKAQMANGQDSTGAWLAFKLLMGLIDSTATRWVMLAQCLAHASCEASQGGVGWSWRQGLMLHLILHCIACLLCGCCCFTSGYLHVVCRAYYCQQTVAP